MELLKVAAFLIFCLAVFVGNPQTKITKSDSMPSPVTDTSMEATEATKETAYLAKK